MTNELTAAERQVRSNVRNYVYPMSYTELLVEEKASIARKDELQLRFIREVIAEVIKEEEENFTLQVDGEHVGYVGLIGNVVSTFPNPVIWDADNDAGHLDRLGAVLGPAIADGDGNTLEHEGHTYKWS